MSIGAVLGERPAIHAAYPTYSTNTLRNRYHDYTALPPADLVARARQELLGEAALEDGARRESVYRRLSAWLDLDPEDARVVARAFDRATDTLSRDLARRRLEDERDAMIEGLTLRDFRRLAGFVPWLSSDEGLAVIGAAAGLDLTPAA